MKVSSAAFSLISASKMGSSQDDTCGGGGRGDGVCAGGTCCSQVRNVRALYWFFSCFQFLQSSYQCMFCSSAHSGAGVGHLMHTALDLLQYHSVLPLLPMEVALGAVAGQSR